MTTEIIHCKDCKYRDYWGDCNKWSKELDAHKSYPLDENMFCGFAEKKHLKEAGNKGDKEQAKQMIEGFTQFMRTLWNNPNLTVPDDMAEKFGIADEFREKRPKKEAESEDT